MTEETQAQAPTITVTDIAALLRIVDAAAERGAFRGEELTSVGGVRDKAASFVNYIREQAEAAQAAAESGVDKETVEESAE